MAERSDEVIRLLRSIDASLKALVKVAQARKSAPQGKKVADDRDLDSQWGNPTVFFNPRDWTGPSFRDRRMSECDPDFLEMLAETFDYFADKAEENDERIEGGKANGKPVAPYKRKDAARARGWAQRIRDGKVPVGAGASDDDEWGRRDEADF
jgi:hypothetical protein